MEKIFGMGTHVILKEGTGHIWKRFMVMEGQMANLGPVETEAGTLGLPKMYDPYESRLPDPIKPYIWQFQENEMNIARHRLQIDKDQDILNQWIQRYQDGAVKSQQLSRDPVLEEKMKEMFQDRPQTILKFLENKNLQKVKKSEL